MISWSTGPLGMRAAVKHPRFKRADLWQITFGDLLTLLLCFFIAIFKFGGFSTVKAGMANPPKTYELMELSTPGLPWQTGVRGSGTSLAIESSELVAGVRQLQIRIREDGFLEDGQSLKPELWEQLRSEVFLVGYRAERVSLEVCAPADLTQGNSGWYRSLRRTTSLKSQLIDAGLSISALRLRAVGPRCELIKNRARSKEQNTSALIEIKFSESSNG